MRTPRRNFVVEYKANRRQTKAPPASIWGNLDLQAVAREVEAEIGLPKPAPSTLSGNEITVEVVAPTTQVDINQDQSANIASPDAELAPPAPIEDSSPTVSAPDTGEAALGLETKPNANRKRAPRKAILPVPPTEGYSDGLTGSRDELQMLEAENCSLKRLMITRLRVENDWLRSKLHRFAVDKR